MIFEFLILHKNKEGILLAGTLELRDDIIGRIAALPRAARSAAPDARCGP